MTYNPEAYLNNQIAQINSLYDAQKQAQLASLQQARARAVGEQESQLGALKPQYADLRNQTDIVSNQNQNKLREMMAANGLSRSGENVTANAGLLNNRQQTLGRLNRQEQEERAAINRRIAAISDPSEENSLLAQIEGERSKAFIDLQNIVAEREYQQMMAEQERAFQAQQNAAERSRAASAYAYQPTIAAPKTTAAPTQLAQARPMEPGSIQYLKKMAKLFDY